MLLQICSLFCKLAHILSETTCTAFHSSSLLPRFLPESKNSIIKYPCSFNLLVVIYLAIIKSTNKKGFKRMLDFNTRVLKVINATVKIKLPSSLSNSPKLRVCVCACVCKYIPLNSRFWKSQKYTMNSRVVTI